MVRRDRGGDRDGVDRVVSEDVLVFGRHADSRVAGHEPDQQLRLQIAYRHDPRIRELVEYADEIGSPVAQADHRDSKSPPAEVGSAVVALRVRHAVPPGRTSWSGVRAISERSRPSDQLLA